ncbi:FERM and PDZ domain-containing protein 2 [Garra rufa]|uniref:FERM and PDZ domain-containing protein 2 n=1 Tax=Garra rufa TaxID=137080 RepID=UPI003CCE635A
MSTFVTLAEVLESRGAPLEEDEVWAVLLIAAEALIDISSKDPGNMCCVISPGSMLLSAVGSVAFKSCGRSEDVGSFASPEMSQSNTSSRRQTTEKMVVYSLGMTLYWAVDYQLPQNQGAPPRPPRRRRNPNQLRPPPNNTRPGCDVELAAGEVRRPPLRDHLHARGLRNVPDAGNPEVEKMALQATTTSTSPLPPAFPFRAAHVCPLEAGSGAVCRQRWNQGRRLPHPGHDGQRSLDPPGRAVGDLASASQPLAVAEAALSPLWQTGIRILNYLDDWLLIAHSRDLLCEQRDLRLAHWVVEAISLSYLYQGQPCPLGVHAHSTRSVASSYALAHGASLADIWDPFFGPRGVGKVTLRICLPARSPAGTWRRKFIIESSTSKKKHIFLTEKSKVAKYLCDLCSAQHKFHREMSSRQLSRSRASEESIVQYAAVCRTQNNELNAVADDSMSRFCEDVATRIEAKIKLQRDLLDHTGSQSPALQRSSCSSPKRYSDVPSMSPTLRDTPTGARSPEREIICVSLKKDPKVGLGIVIVGEDNTGKLDLRIFIASIVPGGPADRDGRIKPGGRLISLNQLSLEGMSFSEAADIMQSSSSEVELIVSQPKALSKRGGTGNLSERNYESQSTILADSRAGNHYLDELVSVMMTPKGTNRLHVPEVRIINAQDDYSRSASLISLRPEEFTVTLQKSGGSLGISIGGVNTGFRYGGIYIKRLVPGGAAEQDGRIQTGDRLLEVDGTRLQGFTDQQAAECLARTGEVVSLVLERDGGSVLQRGPVNPKLRDKLIVRTPSFAEAQMRNSCPAITMTRPFGLKPRDYSFVSDDNIQEVTLKKRLNGLGFSFFITELDTSLDSGSIVRIRTLFPGQPAEESGKIREGDVILSINGEPLKGLSYQRVLQLLRNSPSEVQLLLCRPAQGTLPPISEKIGQLTCS